MIRIHRVHALKDNLVWVVTDEVSKIALVVDPSEAEPVHKFLKNTDYKLQYILNTHHHHDHIGGNQELCDSWGAHIYAPLKNKNEIPGATHFVKEGDVLKLGWIELEVFEIPGHTLGHVAYYAKKENLLFCGDTLFSIGCGKLFEGTPEMMWTTLKKIREHPSETEVFCGHEYTLKNLEFALSLTPNNMKLLDFISESILRLETEGCTLPSLLAIEKRLNPFLRADEAQFAEEFGLAAESPEFVFKTLRKMKDSF
ncbi:MAG: hydroxyacylglutathione hydrolase [Pseudobdellovibrionaceae bacterium]